MNTALENFGALEVPTIDDLHILRAHQYEPVAILGRGGMATVFKVIHSGTGAAYACKIIKKSSSRRGLLGKPNSPGANKASADEEARRAVLNEVAALRACAGHQNVMRLEEVIMGEKNTFLICELGDGGSLEINEPQSEDAAREYFKAIVGAVAHIHSKSMVHGDIKPNNFLMKDGHVLLSDFGTAHGPDCSPLNTTIGTPAFTPPESLDRCDDIGQKYATQEGDAWACGAVLYYLLHAKIPWQDYEGPDRWQAIHKVPLDLREDLSEDVRNVVSSLLATSPESRLSVKESAHHRWFQTGTQAQMVKA